MAMQGLFSVLAMIYKLMTYGANVEYSPHISNLVLARVPLIINNIYNRIALVLGILSVSMGFHL